MLVFIYFGALLQCRECTSATRSTFHAPRSTLHAPHYTLHTPRYTLHDTRYTIPDTCDTSSHLESLYKGRSHHRKLPVLKLAELEGSRVDGHAAVPVELLHLVMTRRGIRERR